MSEPKPQMSESKPQVSEPKPKRVKVHVLNMRGEPLMPCSPVKARKLLQANKAVVKHREPFTIQLTVASGENRQDITLGVDLGSKHVGLSASTKKDELYAAEVDLRPDVSKQIADCSETRATPHKTEPQDATSSTSLQQPCKKQA